MDVTLLLELAKNATEETTRESLMWAAQREGLRQGILACNRCALRSTARAPVPWHGGPSNVVVVGEAPGADEDRMGRPFVGRAGKLLNEALAHAGFDPATVAYVNTVCCRPPNNDFSKAVDAEAPAACRPWLKDQIAITGAWVIIPVGNQALWATMPEVTTGITGIRGKYFWRGVHLYAPTFHPSYALRDRDAKDALYFDLRRLHQVMAGEREVPVPKNYDPSTMISALRKAKLSQLEANKFSTHFKSKGWVYAYSEWLGDHIICVRDEKVIFPPNLPGVVYTVQELIQLSHFDRSWEIARRIHYTKRELNATIV